MTTSSPGPRRSMDWSLGHYEHTAAQLVPAARDVMDRAAPAEGERVVEVGCGRGTRRCSLALRGGRGERALGVRGDVAAPLDAESDNHSLAVAGRGVPEPRGEAQGLRDRMLSIYEAANEDPDGFRVTGRHVVATARRA